MTAPTAIRCGQRRLGAGEPCFVIAEAGSNHNGSLEQALRLIDVAARAGADAVKFQVFRAARLYPKTAGLTDYLKLDKPIYDIIAELELPYEWLPVLAERTRERGLAFMASAFDEESVDRLDPFVEIHKIASYELTHHPLIEHVARTGKPLILSTGTADLAEVAEAVAVFRAAGGEQLVLLQCTAAYPAPLDSLNIRAMAALSEAFGVAFGLSDHSRDPVIGPVTAVAAGGSVVEKHFTLGNDLPGPDHAFAVEPRELEQLVAAVRATEQALGSGDKVMAPVEAELHDFARRFIFAVAPIAPGEEITAQNAAVLRKGKNARGLEARDWNGTLGRRAARALAVGEPIAATDLAA